MTSRQVVLLRLSQGETAEHLEPGTPSLTGWRLTLRSTRGYITVSRTAVELLLENEQRWRIIFLYYFIFLVWRLGGQGDGGGLLAK